MTLWKVPYLPHLLAFYRIEVFLLEIDSHTFFLQLADGGDRVHGIPRKPRYRLCQNQIHLSVKAVGNHLVKSRSAGSGQAGDAIIDIWSSISIRMYGEFV